MARTTAFLREQFVQYVVDTSIQETASQRGHREDTLDMAIDQLPLNQRAVLVLFYHHHINTSIPVDIHKGESNDE